MDAFISKIKFRKRPYWTGGLFKANRLCLFCLPMSSKAGLLNILKSFTEERIVFNNRYRMLSKKVRDYFRGRKQVWGIPLDLSSHTFFAKKVLTAVKKIPYGRTCSYGEIARQAGSPRAARAVGTILARNRLPLFIPCHRVVKSNGSLGGFSGGFGKELKKDMLQLEQMGR